jgi:hypothetical protein
MGQKLLGTTTLGALLNLEYDVAHYASFSVSLGGDLTVSVTGSTITLDSDVDLNGHSLSCSYLSDVFAGTPKAIQDFIVLTNTGNAADMDGTGTAILFQQYYYDIATPDVANSGKIVVGTETDWTSVAGTQDSYMAFYTALDGVVSEKARITSAGKVAIGSTVPYATLQVVGGDSSAAYLTASLAFGFSNSSQYSHFIHSRHNTPGAAGNALDFYTSDGTAAGVYPTNAVHGMTIENGKVGIGTTAPSSFLDLELTGTAKAITNFVELTNLYNAADMDGTGTGVLFNLYYYDVATPAVWDAGRIVVAAEQDATSTGTTQDSYMSFWTSLDGTNAERFRLGSGWNSSPATLCITGGTGPGTGVNGIHHYFTADVGYISCSQQGGPQRQLNIGATNLYLNVAGGNLHSHLDSNGNYGLGTATFGTSSIRVFNFYSGTAPSTSPADSTQLWGADRGGTAGKAGLHIRSEDGTSHVFSDRVGIGTVVPVCTFQTIGTIRADALSNATGLANLETNNPPLVLNSTSNTGIKLVAGLTNPGYAAYIQGFNSVTPTHRPLILQPFGGYAGIGSSTMVPSSLLDIEQSGTAKAITDLLELTNTYNNADMDGTGTGVLFNLYYYDVATPAVWDAGRIVVAAEQDATSTASTQDSYMAFYTSLDGTNAERVRIGSGGQLGVNTTSPASTLQVNRTWSSLNQALANLPFSVVNPADLTEYIFAGYDSTADLGVLGVQKYGSSIPNFLLFVGGILQTDLTQRSAPSAKYDIVYEGTAKAVTNFLALTNARNAADMDGTGTAILWNQWYYDAATPAVADAGRITCVAETDWTSTASTQDSYIGFETALDGTVAERWRVASTGALSNTAALGTAYLHIKAGTATAGEAPLKFTDGVLLATAEEGAEELDVGTRWMTPISTQREAVVGVGAAQYEAFHVTHSE